LPYRLERNQTASVTTKKKRGLLKFTKAIMASMCSYVRCARACASVCVCVSCDQSIWFDECSGGVEAITSASLYNITISSNNIYFEYRQKPLVILRWKHRFHKRLIINKYINIPIIDLNSIAYIL